MTTIIEKKYLKVAEVAEYLGLTESGIRKWIRLGIIPFRKINGAIRFDIEIIDHWINSQGGPRNGK